MYDLYIIFIFGGDGRSWMVYMRFVSRIIFLFLVKTQRDCSLFYNIEGKKYHECGQALNRKWHIHNNLSPSNPLAVSERIGGGDVLFLRISIKLSTPSVWGKVLYLSTFFTEELILNRIFPDYTSFVKTKLTLKKQ